MIFQNARSAFGAALLIFSMAEIVTAAGNELPAALAYIHAGELKINRPGAMDSIVIAGEEWARPMTPVFVESGGETILFAAHHVRHAGGRAVVNIEIANLFMVGADGVRQLTDYGGFTVSPDYSPANRQIVFVSNHGVPRRSQRAHRRGMTAAMNATQLYLLEDSWKMARRLTETAGDKFNPQWSPDGRHVIFAWLRGDTLGIHLLDVATESTVQVAVRGSHPTWRPDGGAIAFSMNGRLFAVEVNDSGTISAPYPLLPDLRDYCSFLRWTKSGLLFQWARKREQGISLLTNDGRVRALVAGAGEYGGSDLAHD
jgi:hypothetical protein